jgi:hypothetical protein
MSASVPPPDATPDTTTPAISPFRVEVPEADLDDLRRRISATRWPDKETVADRSQGAQLAKIKELARYWATDYDWRKAEAKLNALPQFMTNIDGLDIQFIHVRSQHPNSLKWTRVATLRRGNSRNSSVKNSVRRSDHCASWS